MVAVANLRIEVDTSKLRATVSELDKLASKGERTESALQMTSKINMSGAAQVARQMDNLASKARATDTAADMIAQVSSSGFQVVSRQMDALKNKAIATDRFMDMTSTIKTPGWNLVSRQMDNIATRAKAARTQMTGLAGAGRQAGAALRPMAGVATKTGTAMKTSGAHTANLAAQFNDIGVMLAAGQSPLLLAMQQGTQVSQVFTQMGVKGKGALAGARRSFYGISRPDADSHGCYHRGWRGSYSMGNRCSIRRWCGWRLRVSTRRLGNGGQGIRLCLEDGE